MQNFCAEVGEFGGFAIRNFGNSPSFGDQPGIGAEHAVHVGPNNNLIRGYRRAKNRGGIVGTAAAQGGQHAFWRRANESGDHRHDSFLQ